MKSCFIFNENVHKFIDICRELESPDSLIGPSLAVVSGAAGRGKSESAKHFCAENGALYIPPLNINTPAMLLRTISFEISTLRPIRSEESLRAIAGEMAKERRLIIIDEADLLPMQTLEMLRNVSELYSFPILMIGEDSRLESKIASRRRLSSRIRRRLEFGPITQADCLQFLRKALDAKVTPEVCAFIHRGCEGNWRPLLVRAAAIERALRASGLSEITMDLVKGVS